MKTAIMKRSELATKCGAEPTDFSKKAFKKQKNFCNRLYKKERKKYYENLDPRKITDNREFWQTIQPFLSNKTKSSQKICLKEGDRIISDDNEVANILNNHFIGSVRSLAEAGGCSEHVLDYNLLEDPVENVVHRFKHHPSIIAINERKFEDIFEFNCVDLEEVTLEINKLDLKKQPLG